MAKLKSNIPFASMTGKAPGQTLRYPKTNPLFKVYTTATGDL